MKDRVVLQTPVSASKGIYGEQLLTYATSSCWARVVYDNGTTTLGPKGIESNNANYTFYVRRNESLDEQTLIIHEGHQYKIDFLDEITPTITSFKARRIK